MPDFRTFKEFEEHTIQVADNSTAWQYVDGWYIPRPGNQSYGQNKLWHICKENWMIDRGTATESSRSVDTTPLDGCCRGCGKSVPDSIKMIAMLLSW